MPDTFVIVGGGLAGAKAAEALRAEGFDGRVVLVGEEPELPYERPPLSKSYLAGESFLDEARVHPEAFYAEHDVELRTGTRATELDPHARRLQLAGGDELRYDRLLLATGAQPRRPPIPGADGPGVHLLRTAQDADALRAVLQRGGRLAVVGGGWIGSEVAATARTLGADVVLVERAAAPLEHVVGPELGRFFASLHEEHGVELITGAQVAAIEPGPRVRLHDDRTIACDAVLLAVGVAPDTALAQAARLHVEDGIVTGARLETSASGVFAAGDVAAVDHPRYGPGLRVEHWATAIAHGTAAARAMLGREVELGLPSFFSDQYDVGLEYVGRHAPEDRLHLQGAPEDRRFRALWTDGADVVTAAMHVNDWGAIDELAPLVGHPLEVPAG